MEGLLFTASCRGVRVTLPSAFSLLNNKHFLSRRLRRFSQIWLSRLLGFCQIRGFAVPARLRLSTCAQSASSLQVVDAQGASLFDAFFLHTLYRTAWFQYEGTIGQRIRALDQDILSDYHPNCKGPPIRKSKPSFKSKVSSVKEARFRNGKHRRTTCPRQVAHPACMTASHAQAGYLDPVSTSA